MGSQTSSNMASSHSTSYHRHKHHRSAGRPLLVLHILNSFFSFASISIFGALLPVWNANFFHSTGIAKGDWPDTLPLLPLCITFIASLLYLTKLWLAHRRRIKSIDYIKSRSTPRSPSPQSWKVQIYVTFTILVLLLTFLILAGISGLYRFWRPAVITSSVELSSGTSSSLSLNALSLRRDISDSNPVGLTPPTNGPSGSNPSQSTKATFHSCTFTNIFTRACNPTLYLIGDLQIAAIATGSVVWLINLALIVLQAREYQYQKCKHQLSLRAKVKAKANYVGDEASRAEKGEISNKKIHHERGQAHSKPSSKSSLTSQSGSSNFIPPLTRPKRARTNSSDRMNATPDHPATRPKQHHYNPEITPSRSRSVREVHQGGTANLAPAPLRTAYSRAVEDARRNVKPAETMRDWLDRRYS